jgi:Icc-related predicted phosphoesterase
MENNVKFRIMSDLHLEGNIPPVITNEDNADVLILAGDICTPKSLPTLHRFFKQCSDNFDLVLYVTGNHELYRWEKPNDKSHITFIRDALQSVYPNLMVLEDEVINYKGLRIAGATLWTNFGKDAYLYEHCHQIMNDYRWGLKQKSVLDWFRHSYAFLSQSKADVVITHHAPSELSVHPMYAGNRYNALFHSNLDELIQELRPHLWVHGHMHNNAEYTCGATKVVCNPYGYGKENVHKFDLRKVINVPIY